ncbi:cytochrome c oxidase subunit 2 [Aphelenchoides avenae]|nr:cytochrome c oxidase subunit 2 [Aphelenchus avenae]
MASTAHSRSSVLNKTIVVSKRASRPNLPQAHPPSGSNVPMHEGDEVGNDPDAAGGSHVFGSTRNHKRRDTITVESQSLHDVQRHFNEVAKMDGMSDSEKFDEVRHRVLSLVDTKDKEFNARLMKREKDYKRETSMVHAQLTVANQTVKKVEQFCSILRENGIDLERVLRKEPGVLMDLQYNAAAPGREFSPDQEADIVRLTRERDAALEDNRSLDGVYSDLLRRYEKLRVNSVAMKANEETFRKAAEDMAVKYAKLMTTFRELHEDAQHKLQEANTYIAKLEKKHTEDTLGLRMNVKKAESRIKTLEATIATKVNENEELHKICEELIAKSEMTDSMLSSA